MCATLLVCALGGLLGFKLARRGKMSAPFDESEKTG
jgi:hypothetical protein